MANFYEAYKITSKHEGGYSNHPNDVGGETYKGISRKYHPNWDGWIIIDSLKGPLFPNNLESNNNLQMKVSFFYKENYWNKIKGDDIKYQEIANELYDTGVNMGTVRVTKFLQEGLNLLNLHGKSWSNISVDGVIGNITLNILNNILPYNDVRILYNIMNVLQGIHYINFTRTNESQEVFMRGWFNRIDIIKR